MGRQEQLHDLSSFFSSHQVGKAALLEAQWNRIKEAQGILHPVSSPNEHTEMIHWSLFIKTVLLKAVEVTGMIPLWFYTASFSRDHCLFKEMRLFRMFPPLAILHNFR